MDVPLPDGINIRTPSPAPNVTPFPQTTGSVDKASSKNEPRATCMDLMTPISGITPKLTIIPQSLQEFLKGYFITAQMNLPLNETTDNAVDQRELAPLGAICCLVDFLMQ